MHVGILSTCMPWHRSAHKHVKRAEGDIDFLGQELKKAVHTMEMLGIKLGPALLATNLSLHPLLCSFLILIPDKRAYMMKCSELYTWLKHLKVTTQRFVFHTLRLWRIKNVSITYSYLLCHYYFNETIHIVSLLKSKPQLVLLATIT